MTRTDAIRHILALEASLAAEFGTIDPLTEEALRALGVTDEEMAATEENNHD